MIEQTTLVLKNNVTELEKVMSFISSLCARNSISPEIEYDLNLALDEVISNIVRHAFPDGQEHTFTVNLSLNDQEFVARIEDEGVEFDPTQHQAPDLNAPLEERKLGGLGIHLVRQIMDGMEYDRVAGKNLLTLRKKWTKSTP
jgi:anti-sigma regulatory factor (Ser/Thr protein kinase)